MPQIPARPQRTRQLPVTPNARSQSSTWDTAVNAFLGDCRRRNLSPATTDTYASILSNPRTAEFRKDHQVQSARDLTADRLKAFETELFDAGLSSGSVMGYHRVMKTFARFCLTEGYAEDEALLQVEGPKQEQYEPEVFTEEEEKRLIAAADNERDRLLVEFMLATGLRLGEVANVTIDDIVESPSGAYVRVRQGKGRKDRIVPLDTNKNRMSRKLHRYIEHSRPKDSSEKALFISRRASADGNYTPLTRRGIQIILYRLGQKTGIHVHPHKFRHTFATRALSAGVDVMALRKALGHTTLVMVSRYVHYQKDDLLEAWRHRRD